MPFFTLCPCAYFLSIHDICVYVCHTDNTPLSLSLSSPLTAGRGASATGGGYTGGGAFSDRGGRGGGRGGAGGEFRGGRGGGRGMGACQCQLHVRLRPPEHMRPLGSFPLIIFMLVCDSLA